MIDLAFLIRIFMELLRGLPVTLVLAAIAVTIGFVIALPIAIANTGTSRILRVVSGAYIVIFRGVPVLVVLFIIYYGLSQFVWIRGSALWPFLREPWWCAIVALSITSAAFGADVLKGGIQSVQQTEIEAGRAFGMGPFLLLRRITLPLALRQALPAYTNEVTLVVKATSLASIITLMEITGIARKLISQTFRPIEVLVAAAILYLAINWTILVFVHLFDKRLSRQSSSPSSRESEVSAR